MPATCTTIELWPEPALGTKEEAIKSALKSHRDLSRVQLNTHQTTETGVSVSEWLTWLLEVWTKVDELPPIHRAIVKLYFLTEGRGGLQRTNDEVGQRLGISGRQVARLKRAAVDAIAARVWPE